MASNDSGEDVDVDGGDGTSMDMAQTRTSTTAETVGKDDVSEPSKKKMKSSGSGGGKRADYWAHFKFVEGSNQKKCECIHCGFVYSCDGKKHGTTNLKNHIEFKCKGIERKNQATINLSKGIGGDAVLSNWRFDLDACRKALAYMVIMDELPFRFVEGEGFRRFCNVIQPRLQIPSRITVAKDCYQVFVDEREKLKKFLVSNSKCVSITIDTWTSIQRINYMCVTAHFIDNEWTLQKRILNFCPISGHKGETIGKAIEKALGSWGIENLMTITVDNASSNDTAIVYLKRKMMNSPRLRSIQNGNYLHMRCVAHIINLVVNDGLKLASDSIIRVRNAVRYIRQSPARLLKFKICIEDEKIQFKNSLCLDVPTRWNSTYLMLETALKFERAFVAYEDHDPFYVRELLDGEGLGKPEKEDWDKVKHVTQLLKAFYDLTLRVSGSLYVTANTYFHEISSVDILLRDWAGTSHNDKSFSDMALKMKEKCDKYWGNPEKINMMIFFAVVLDPQYKMEYLDFVVGKMYPKPVADKLIAKVKVGLKELFTEYKSMYSTQSDHSSRKEQIGSSDASASASVIDLDDHPMSSSSAALVHQWKQMKAISGIEAKSELDKYLDENCEDGNESFSVLTWWRVNSPRFPILSLIARDILAIPVSTVASESAFSTGGRVLDPFRSSLSPKIVEALICTQDWMRAALRKEPINIEEQLVEIEKLDQELESIPSAPPIVDIA